MQNRLGNSYWLATGDAVTIMPDSVDPAVPESTPGQYIVRYAATDGYYQSDNSLVAISDTRNEWFTFTERVSALTIPRPLSFSWVMRGRAAIYRFWDSKPCPWSDAAA